MKDDPPPPTNASLSRRLAELFGPEVDPHISLGPVPTSASVRELVADLPRPTTDAERYEIVGEIDRGGMGVVLEAWDRDLRRPLAMKVAFSGEGAARADQRRVARFLEEAQITAQLDHPGVVPVHELGLNDEGNVFFTMRRVRGRDLREVLHCVQYGLDGWTEARALSVLLRVCEAVAFAHSRGVIHRDLKPANVMVGAFGEVYVMDWGLARVLGRESGADPAATDSCAISTVLGDERERSPVSPLVTSSGDVMGTPAYMPPEQARGDVEALSPRSDVYSIGAMLYHLLAHEPPYLADGRTGDAVEALQALRRGPPRPLDEVRAGIPPALVAICAKAMAFDDASRYPGVQALADDLNAFVERRVVAAYETGALAETRQWLRRNRPLAAALAATVLALVLGVVATATQWVRADDEAFSARANEDRALQSESVARAETAKVLRLADALRLEELERQAESLWPALPDRAVSMRDWLERARALIGNLAVHRATLVELRARSAATDEGALRSDPEPRAREPRSWRFDDVELQWQHDILSDLVLGLERLDDADPSVGARASVEARLAFAASLEERSLRGPDAVRRWGRTVEAIATSERYGSLRLRPQLGLLPLGADPDSGLWEFAHLASGAPAERRADGRLELDERTGAVLVLLPAGRFLMGAQSQDPSAPGYDPAAHANESPVHAVELDAFFLSKYELTRAQWLRATRSSPTDSAWHARGQDANPLHPITQVGYEASARVLGWLDLRLPTEAQWEYAARAGTAGAWWTGDLVESLQGAANLAPEPAQPLAGATWPALEPELVPARLGHVHVGSFAPNAFGLHDTMGNVFEWCRDGFALYDVPPSAGDGARSSASAGAHPRRGGGYLLGAYFARSACRNPSPVGFVSDALGLRPARPVQ